MYIWIRSRMLIKLLSGVKKWPNQTRIILILDIRLKFILRNKVGFEQKAQLPVIRSNPSTNFSWEPDPDGMLET